MISALVISLSLATERREFQRRQLSALGLSFEILEVKPLCKARAQDVRAVMKPWQRPLRDPEIGAWLSHRQAWNRVQNQGHPWLILEDDALLSQDTAAILQALEPHMAAYDCVSLEARQRYKWIQAKSLVLDSSYSLHRLIQDRSGAAAYVLSPRGARTLLRQTEGQLGLADALIWTCRPLRMGQILPTPAVQLDVCQSYGLKPPIKTSSYITCSGKAANSVAHRARRGLAQLEIGVHVLKNLGGIRRVRPSVGRNFYGQF